MLMKMILVIIASLQGLLMRSVEASSSIFTPMSTFSITSSTFADSLDQITISASLDCNQQLNSEATLPHQLEVVGDAHHDGLQNQAQNAQVFRFINSINEAFSLGLLACNDHD